jgi:hypothetical protein
MMLLSRRYPLDPDNIKKYVIPVQQMWKFSEEHNEDFEKTLMLFAGDVYRELGIGNLLILSNWRKMQILSTIARLIQEGIDDYLNMPPEPESHKPDMKVIGEGEVFINGEKVSTFDYTSRMKEDAEEYGE